MYYTFNRDCLKLGSLFKTRSGSLWILLFRDKKGNEWNKNSSFTFFDLTNDCNQPMRYKEFVDHIQSGIMEYMNNGN